MSEGFELVKLPPKYAHDVDISLGQNKVEAYLILWTTKSKKTSLIMHGSNPNLVK